VNKEGRLALTGLASGTVLASLALYKLCTFNAAGLEATKAKILLSETLGSPFMALATDCTAPGKLVAGLAECLGDIPGGYCYHTSCDVIQAPCLTLDQPFKVAILPVYHR
jgi:hypothetical protein